jgi:hypothetical protein
MNFGTTTSDDDGTLRRRARKGNRPHLKLRREETSQHTSTQVDDEEDA